MPLAAATFDLNEHVRPLRAEIDTALARLTEYERGCPAHLAAAIRHSLLAPGKRLRPLLVLMACQACGYDHGAAMPAACAVEMIHTYSLIHDDLPAMDDDDMRRGRPACHKAFGEATAILAGDALLAQAFEVLATGIQPPETAVRCVAELANAAGASELVGGQEDDLKAEFARLGLAELEQIHRRKTGAMIRVSLRLGGIVARATEQQLSALGAFGEKLGLAFQIVDDLLDLQGSEESLGKRTGKDDKHGKLTFPALLGAAESRRRAESLVAGAIDGIGIFGARAEPLAALAKYVTEREN